MRFARAPRLRRLLIALAAMAGMVSATRDVSACDPPKPARPGHACCAKPKARPCGCCKGPTHALGSVTPGHTGPAARSAAPPSCACESVPPASPASRSSSTTASAGSVRADFDGRIVPGFAASARPPVPAAGVADPGPNLLTAPLYLRTSHLRF